MSKLLNMKAILLRKEPMLRPADCVVEKIIEMQDYEFYGFISDTTSHNWLIQQYSDLLINNTTDKKRHCLLFLNRMSGDGVLVDPEGADYARYAQYIPHAADILLAQDMTESERMLHRFLTDTVKERINEALEKGEFDMNEILNSEKLNEMMRSVISDILVKQPAICVRRQENDILSIKKAPLITTKLYCPLKVVVDEGDRYPAEISSRAMRFHEDEINKAINESINYEGAEKRWLERGLIAYSNNERLNAVVHSAFPSVEDRNGNLYGVVTVESFDELSNEELYDLKNEITDQFADGWGESFERQNVVLADNHYDYYISFWGAKNYFLKPESELFPQQEMTMKM